MYSYEWDASTGGYILTPTPLKNSLEPRPVYYKEMDILGFDKYWTYDKNDAYPYMWAEANKYYYRGKLVAKTKGGSVYSKPEVVILDTPELEGRPLRFVDIPSMIEKNQYLLEQLVQETIKKIYNTYIEYKDSIDVFYVAFSGGKDSVVALDLVQRALPHNDFKVVFGDTGMELSDTYKVIDDIELFCKEQGISFYRAKSKMQPEKTWKLFGPPAVTMRWCCSVHKTTPQIMLLRSILGINDFTGMAFTGVRGDESQARDEYDEISVGEKHSGQYSCHAIIDWNTAELFLYIYQNHLILNSTYKKGGVRAGCLVCPMAYGKSEYIKHVNYSDEVGQYVNRIIETSGKKFERHEEFEKFIDDGGWRTRKSGRELNLGTDKHQFNLVHGETIITVYGSCDSWKEWVKTIGSIIEIDKLHYTIDYKERVYQIEVKELNDHLQFSFPNIDNSKDSIKFLSLFKSCIIKSTYCIHCGVCVAECKNGCIQMDGKISISDKCIHCHECHDIYSHCLRYNSIKNSSEGKKMNGMDRYFSFGIKENWLRVYFDYEGSESFWNTDGDGEVPNKKKDAFLNFLKDCDLVSEDESLKGKEYKYTKWKPNSLAAKLFNLGIDNESVWAILMVRLVNAKDSDEFKWFIQNINFNETTTLEMIKYRLSDVMAEDKKGLGKRNICDALKSFIVKTPFGTKLGLGVNSDYTIKTQSNGNEVITLNSFIRGSWNNPDERVILYSLYKFAEACGGSRQFTLTRLLDTTVESTGISPTQIFGLDRDVMDKILNGLNFNYKDLIEYNSTLGLDNITLKSDLSAEEVLNELF